MKEMLNLFKANLHLWICPTVYVWALAVQGNIGLGDESMYERIIDCAAVLVTGVFWISAVYVFLVVLAVIVRKPFFVSDVSRFGCEAAILVGTLFYFYKWLHSWQILPVPVLSSVTGLLAIIALAFWTRYRRRLAQRAVTDSATVFQDSFKYGALPVIGLALVLVVSKIAIHGIQRGSVKSDYVDLMSQGPISTRPNVVLVVMDTLRAENMSLYGYRRRTTPYVDEFAQKSNVYLDKHANSTMTKIEVTTILTGKHPFSHGRISPLRQAYNSEENLLNILQRSGYITAAVSSIDEASLYTLGFSDGLSVPEYANFELPSLHVFHKYGTRQTKAGTLIYRDVVSILEVIGLSGKAIMPVYYGGANSTFETASSLIETLRGSFFLLIHTFDTHDPYNSPPPFRGIYSHKEPEMLANDTQLTIYTYYDPEEQPIVGAHRDKYDESIRYLDSELGRFLARLLQSRHGANTLVILTSDHGESFERGYFGHGEELYESSTRVPLIIRWPNQETGRKIKGMVQSVDIAPTILDAVGIPVPPWMDGRPLTRQNEVPESDAVAINYKHPVNDTFYKLPTKLAIWSMPYKAIFHCETARVELYHLRKDPEETNDLSAREPALREELTRRLQKHLQKGSGKELLSCTSR